MSKAQIREQVATAARAAENKKAIDLTVLEMDRSSSAFTDFFVICSGNNQRQVQAIADEVQLQLKRIGQAANSIEGYSQGEWVLMDYVDFVVHVFSQQARQYYDLERLWKSAKRMSIAELSRKPAARKPAARKPAKPAAKKMPARKKPAAKKAVGKKSRVKKKTVRRKR
jgi:ribosome-associated protein